MSPSPLRVLALTSRADFGGGPEHLYQLARHYDRDVALCIACPLADTPYGARFRRLLGADNLLPLPHRRFTLTALWRLVRAVKQRDITLIHSHGKGAGIYGRLLGLLTGRPVVHTYHGLHIGSYGPLRRAAYLALERALSGLSRAVICVSTGERSALQAARLAPEHKLHVIENGVELAKNTRAPRQGKGLRVIAVSRFDHQKNAEETVEIAAYLKQLSAHPVRLTILGQGPGRATLMATIKARGLNDVIRCPGAVDTPRAYFRDADIMLSTSRWEGMPLAVLEAMSEGLCPVLSDVVGNADVVRDGQTGRLFPLGQPEQTARLILSLSASTTHQLGAAARTHIANRYSVARMTRHTQKLYRQVLPPRPAQSGDSAALPSGCSAAEGPQ